MLFRSGLLRLHAERIDADDLARARRQLAVRRLRAQDKPLRRIEDAALDLFVHGRLRDPGERMAALESTRSEDVRRVFERLLEDGPSLAITGAVRRGTGVHARERLAKLARG